MAAQTGSLRGWTIAEAIERTSDADRSVDPANESAIIASRQKSALWDRMFSGQLVATGCFETETSPRVPIDPEILRTLDWAGAPSSTLNGIAGLDLRVFNVQIFPVLHAPNTGTCLDGLSLAEAFQRYVINDPEVVALSKRLLKTDARHSAVFLKGQAPGFSDDFHWPLDSTASEIAFRFVALPFFTIGDPLPMPSAALAAVSSALADRLQGLRDVLSSGGICAIGTFTLTGVEGPRGPLQWTRSGISIDVSRGDLCEGQDFRAEPKWTGLSLRLVDGSLSGRQSLYGPAPKLPEIRRKGEAQIQTKEKCRIECVGWLENIMRASPEIRTASKSQLWAKAQSKWPKKFGLRAFEAAWTEAVAKAETPAWRAAGRPRKSPHL